MFHRFEAVLHLAAVLYLLRVPDRPVCYGVVLNATTFGGFGSWENDNAVSWLEMTYLK